MVAIIDGDEREIELEFAMLSDRLRQAEHYRSLAPMADDERWPSALANPLRSLQADPR